MRLVGILTDKIIQDACDEACLGTEVDVDHIKTKLIDDSGAGEIADLFKTLGDPTRVKIIHALSQSELCVHDLTQVLEMGQSAISHQCVSCATCELSNAARWGKRYFIPWMMIMWNKSLFKRWSI